MPSRKASTPAPVAGSAGAGLKVTSRQESFWRGGLQFTRDPRVLPLADLTPEQADAIRAEGDGGQLVVEEVEIDAAKG